MGRRTAPHLLPTTTTSTRTASFAGCLAAVKVVRAVGRREPTRWASQGPCLPTMLLFLLLAALSSPAHALGLDQEYDAHLPESDRPRYRTAYACEGSTLNMECDPGHVINLIRANYGRFSITICNEHGNTEWSVNCMSTRSHRVLHDKCSQRQNCSVAASTRGFGDPCPGTLKYLEAHFQCVPVNPPSNTARPRPPWFIATKTTVSSMTEDDPPLPQQDRADSGRGGESDFNLEGQLKPPSISDPATSSTSTTTTLKPPPWLITNTAKNITTTTSTTTTTTTTTTTSTTTTSSTTTPKPDVIASKGNDASGGSLSEDDSSRKLPSSVKDEAGGPVKTMTEDTYFDPSSTTPAAPISIPGAIPTESIPDENLPVDTKVFWCPPSSGRDLLWNWTKGGERAMQPCPAGASGWARRTCNARGWAGPADLSDCRSVWLNTLMTRDNDHDAVLAVAHDLKTVTGSHALYGGDVTATARLLNSLARRMKDDISNFPDDSQREALVTELVGTAIATGSHLVARQRAAWGDLRPEEHRQAATSLLLGLEEATFLLADNLHHEQTVVHAESNILMRLQVIENRNAAAVTFPSPGETWSLEQSQSLPSPSNEPPSSPETLPEPPEDTITLPPEALLENSENGLVKMVFFSYSGLHHVLYPDGFNMYRGLNETRVINSRVVSASLGAGRHIELPEPVVLTFKMILTVNVTNPACVFWDYTTNSWSEEGCRVLRYNTSHTICECDHLTNFAVLMDIHATPLAYPHQLALSIITYVGCVISIVCLLLATIVFHAFRGLKSDRTTIHKNLCVCLLIAECVFLGGVNQTDKPVVCGVVAGLLHYFFLAAFAWMFMEGFQLYVMLVEVFEAEKSRVRWYYAGAYGVPAVVVAVSAVVDPFSYGTPEACWLKADNYFIFAFVGPVIAVIIANSVFLSMALFIICRHANVASTLKNKEHTKLASIRTWVRGAIVLMFLLGLTWTFGLLYLNKASVVMAYIFTVLNSLQGLFIFIFHCVQNDKVKKEFRRACRRHPWLRVCLRGTATPSSTSSTTTDNHRRHAKNARGSAQFAGHHNTATTQSLMPRLTSGRWNRGDPKGSASTSAASSSQGNPVVASSTQQAPPMINNSTGSMARGGPPRGSLTRTSHRSSSRSARHHSRTASHDHEDEKYSFKSCGRDSGHGGSEQEDSPRAGPATKLASLRLNNNVAPHHPPDHPHLVNPFTSGATPDQGGPSPEALLPDYRMANDAPTLRLPHNASGGASGNAPRPHRTQSPWNHTYTEIPDGGLGMRENVEAGTDPVYEEIEREGRSEIQVSDLSDEDGRRHSSDISRQSSRSYSDHRPLLPYTLSDRHDRHFIHHLQQQQQQQQQQQMQQQQQQQNHQNQVAQLSVQQAPYDIRLKNHVRSKEGLHYGLGDGIAPHLLPAANGGQTLVSPGHIVPMTHAAVTTAHALPPGNGHVGGMPQYSNGAIGAVQYPEGLGPPPVQYSEAVLAALAHQSPVVQPLSEPNLRNWEAAQRHRDLQQLQQLGEMTVAVLNGEQVVCKLKPPLAPIHENTGPGAPPERLSGPTQPYSQC
ncbi:latrophilin Cirl-like isoform X2 [Oratosquilla oratoria]|uniref:latrophilin Cirl-like isoform X2 n=1 Tax=Oratosquilla oratoria TaxID=337810 RepID=UPI003F76D0C2